MFRLISIIPRCCCSYTHSRLLSSPHLSNVLSFCNYSTKTNNIKFANLSSQRSLIRLSGSDTLPYLQGLITNDVAHLQGKPSIYALFLNHLGRVLYDTLIFNSSSSEGAAGEGETELLVECDNVVKEDLIKYLKKFKLRKKVQVKDVEDSMKLFVLFNDSLEAVLESQKANPTELIDIRKKTDEILQETLSSLQLPSSSKYFVDPRLPELGYRLIIPNEESTKLESSAVSSPIISYTRLRYALGVAEGSTELPLGNCFPLESNADYLHGISFQKGCYIGQELTARTHHTGVVRKRIMPIELNCDESSAKNLNGDMFSSSNIKKSLGKVRGVNGTSAIGLVRIEEAINSPELKVGDTKVNVAKPFWWAKKEVHKL